jgi:8-oxo-dGTP diphosphatase
LKVGAGALIERDGALLLIRRTDDPFRGCWNLPAGYAEADEAPLETVVREVHEETGLRVAPESLVDVYYFDDDPRGNGILIVYKCRSVGGILRASRESVDPTFFGASEVPKDLAGGGHNQAILAWRGAQGPGRDG